MKRRISKVLTAFMLCVCMLFSAACGGGGNNGENWWTNEGELTKDENGNVVFDNVEFKLSTIVNGEDKAAFNTLVTKFNRLYDGKINVIVTNIPAESFETTISKQITNKSNPPDLIMSHQKANRNFADNRLIQPFDEIMEASGIVIDLDNYAEGLAQYSSAGYEDVTYAIPVDAQSFVVFYNKKLLAKYADSVPADRESLTAVLKAFKADSTNNGKAPIGWSTGGDYFSEYVFLTAILQNGGEFYNKDDYRAEWVDDETNFAAFNSANQSFRELINNGYANYGEADNKVLSEFMAGERLFYFTTPWTMEAMVENYAKQLGVSSERLMDEYLGGASMSGWFAMSDNPAKNSIYGDSHFFSMSRSVADVNKKAAICEFVRWFTEDSSAGAEWGRAGHISASNKITEAEDYQNNPYVSNYIYKFYPNIDDFHSIGATPYYEAIISNLSGIFTDTVGNTKNPSAESDKASIKQRQEAVNAQIDFFA